MLVAAMGGYKQGMTVLVMQQEKGSAAQDDAQTPDQPTWDERVTVDGLAMSVHIAGQRVRLCCFSCFFHWCVPEVRGPAGKGDARFRLFFLSAGPFGSARERRARGSVG